MRRTPLPLPPSFAGISCALAISSITDPLAGVLVEQGPAAFQHQQGNARSYFVSLRDRSGEVKTHWGLDLERAMGESGARVGDQVQLARLGKKRVQFREPIRNDAGFVIDYEAKETERSTWSVTVQERGSAGRAEDGADPLAAKVVELFTAKRLATLPAEERVRFRELYQQAKAWLEQGDRPQEAPEQPLNEVSRHRDRGVAPWVDNRVNTIRKGSEHPEIFAGSGG